MGLGHFVFLAVVLSVGCAAAPVTVPFVGCSSDGQQDAIPAPKGKSVVVALPPAVAAGLAFYRAESDLGTLAPRGWHCFGLYGSNGWILIVTPQPLQSADFFGEHNKPLTGPAIQISQSEGGTSGRFEVARLIARYFPNRRAFLQSVITEGIEPAKSFPAGPVATDRIVTRHRDFIEVLTPPRHKGLGTMSRLDPSALPIHAAAAVVGGDDEDWAGYVFAVRVPADQESLAPIILRWAERTYLTAK